MYPFPRVAALGVALALLSPLSVDAQSTELFTRTYQGCDSYFCHDFTYTLLKAPFESFSYYGQAQVRTTVLADLLATEAQSFSVWKVNLTPLTPSTDDLQYVDFQFVPLSGVQAGTSFDRSLAIGGASAGSGAMTPFAPFMINTWGFDGVGPFLPRTIVSSSVRLTLTPEPETWTLLGMGLLAIGSQAARRKRTTV